MRARENNMEQSNQSRAWGSIEYEAQYVKPKVVETFNRPPYAPVLNFKKEEE